MTSSVAARTVVEALRLDQWGDDEVQARVDRALALGVGGFILFGGEAESVARLTAGIRSAAGRDLWIAADLERGAGQQFRGLSELPPPAALAVHPDPVTATEYAAVTTAREARSVGVNWVLAPVLDIDAERQNPIVATRSFGADPETVARLGRRWIASCQAVGALACAKHFPGHGRTKADSHIELPIVDSTAAELDLDLSPFREVAAVVESIMVAHVAYPAYGGDRAATVTPEIVDGLLRRELQYAGLVATDAMIMAGAGADDALAAVEAIRAGCDVILYPGDVGATVDALQRAAEDDTGFADRLVAAARRSDQVLARFPDAGSEESTVAGGSEAEAEALAFAVSSIVDGSGNVGGLDPRAPTEVVALADDPQIGPPAGRAGPLGDILVRHLGSASWDVRLRSVDLETDPATRPPPTGQRIVVLAATPRGWKGHGGPSEGVATRVREELAASDRGLLVLLGHQRWLDELDVPGICGWSTETVMELASAEWIDRHAQPGTAT